METKIEDKATLEEWRRGEAEWERAVLDTAKHKKLRNPYLLDKSKGMLSRYFASVHMAQNTASQGSPRSNSLT